MKSLLLLAVAVAGLAGCAQNSPRPDAPPAQYPPLEYRSAFAGYSAFRDEAIAPWRDANEAVKESAKPQPGHEHGGHR